MVGPIGFKLRLTKHGLKDCKFNYIIQQDDTGFSFLSTEPTTKMS